MPTEDDVAVVRRFFAAVEARDLATVGECFREDAVWYLPGTGPLAGAHRGWPAIRDDLFAKQGPLSGGTFRPRLLDLAVGADYIVAVVHATAEHAGRRLDQTVCQLMRVRGGKIVEVRGHYADQAALDAFWGPDPSRPTRSVGAAPCPEAGGTRRHPEPAGDRASDRSNDLR